MSGEAWWRRLDGQPDWMVKQRGRMLGHREVVLSRVLMVLIPFLTLGGALAFRDWSLVPWSVFPLLQLVILPHHQRQQIFGRQVD